MSFLAVFLSMQRICRGDILSDCFYPMFCPHVEAGLPALFAYERSEKNGKKLYTSSR
jgi:hypothetical protein